MLLHTLPQPQAGRLALALAGRWGARIYLARLVHDLLSWSLLTDAGEVRGLIVAIIDRKEKETGNRETR